MLAIALRRRSKRPRVSSIIPSWISLTVVNVIARDRPLDHHGTGHLDLRMCLDRSANYGARIGMDVRMRDHLRSHRLVRSDGNNLPRNRL